VGCGTGTDAASINCAITAGATIASYTGVLVDPNTGVASGGLGSGHASLFGYGPAAFGLDVAHSAAFGGINQQMGVGYFQYPAGRSVYNALQTEYKQQLHSPFRGVTGMNLQIAYTLSRYEGNGGDDQNFSAGAYDFRNPTGFFGPTSLDATHQFKFGATFDVAHHGPRVSFIGGFRSAHPSNLFLNSPGQFSPAEVLRTDLTGDGTVGDLINAAGGKGKPGTFMRDVSPGNLASVINNFNSNVAGTLTPAGQALVSAGLFTQQQLVSLGAVVPTIAAPPANNAGNSMYKDVDTVLTWPIKIKERFTIEPSIGVFNLFNFANFAGLGSLSTPLGQLNGGPGSPNGTIGGNDPSHNVLRSGLGTGVFAAGAPREMEFGLRINF